MTTSTRPSGQPLTERQEARRQRILRATTALAAKGGLDAVQMREVAELSDVALGTLYRYFPSKIHLLVATMYDQLEQLSDQLRKKPPRGEDPGERVTDALMRAFRALQREPNLAEAMLRALTFADRSVSAEVDAVSNLTTMIVMQAMRGQAAAPATGPATGPADGPGDRPSADELAAIRVVEHVWHSALLTWLSGRASITQVRGDIETAAKLIAQAAPAA
jgi:TetR/AcrR family transcriptional regulator, cholesterol catabolism regulator